MIAAATRHRNAAALLSALGCCGVLFLISDDNAAWPSSRRNLAAGGRSRPPVDTMGIDLYQTPKQYYYNGDRFIPTPQTILLNLYASDKTMQISRENKLVYVHIPKTGGSSVERSDLFGDAHARHVVGGHYPIEAMLRDSAKRGLDGFVTAATIRHPCSRFISAFNYMKKAGNDLDREWSSEHIGGMDLLEFVRSSDPGKLGWSHFEPQYTYLFDKHGNFNIDVVMCQEEWDEGLHRLDAALRDNNKMKEEDNGQGKQQPVVPVGLFSRFDLKMKHASCPDIDDEARAFIERIYAMDYCIFGYKRGGVEDAPSRCGRMTKKQYSKRYRKCWFELRGIDKM